MSGTEMSQEKIDEAIRFHGHWCPGLAIGIRASELALREIGHAFDEEIVGVTETDMCAVDAVQFFTGCTFGKGNLIFKDHGKTAFTFYRRADGKAVRLVFKPEAAGEPPEELMAIQKKIYAGEATEEDQEKYKEIRAAWCQRILDGSLDEIFEIKPALEPPPKRAQILRSVVCDACGEKFMESRSRRFMGQTLCIPCFEAIE